MTCLSELLLLLFITPLATQNLRTLKLSHLNNTLYTCSDPQCSPSTLVTVYNIRHCQMCQLFVDIATYMGTLSIQMDVETMIAIDNRKLSAPTTSKTTSSTTSSTTTTTPDPYACGNMTLLIGYNVPGDDITSEVFNSYTLCCQWCLSYNGCVAFTWGLSGWANSTCFIKNAIPASINDSEFISAHY
ncbi:unnamed protein product [Adineta ricciae]|uniref:Apple domain-containing protein n=1 Tax=Adineta ricciae TaxID=249248 RepID=A0A816E9R4_ADIRI|nr:unnamed protein product [Adineta ricciae]